jgi:ketosteroid isomerase-like protein
MTRENVEVIRKLYAGWSRGDFRVGLEFFAPDLRFVIDGSITPTPGEWSGVEGMRDAWREGLTAWEDYRTGPIEHLIESEDQVAAFNHMHGRGKQSQIPTDSRLWAAVFTFREGKIAQLLLTDLQGALEAVGLRE